MAIFANPHLLPFDDPEIDPDDYRPRSVFSVLADPVREDGIYARDLSVILERIAPGDTIPLHRHPIEEAIVVEAGTVEMRLGDETQTVTARSAIFVPIGVPHGARNVGVDEAVYTAFFPSAVIEIEYLERNPAPGTEGEPPQPAVTYDARAG